MMNRNRKRYFVVGMLLLGLSHNIARGMEMNESSAQRLSFFLAANTFGTAWSAFMNAIVKPFVEDWFKGRPQIIVCSSHESWVQRLKGLVMSKKADEEQMIFSGKVKLKLDDFAAIAKNINEKIKNNSEIKYQNLLLYGPPGTGKTMYAEKLARKLHDECGMEWIMVTGSGFFQEGAYVKAVNDIFINEVKRNKKKGIIIIIDEADSLFGARENLRPDSESYRVINQILSFMGTRTNNRMVIMTSNHPIFDSAMERRTDAIKVGLPGNKERIETLRLYRNNFSLAGLSDAKIEKIAAHTKDFSQSDLAGIVDELKMKSDIDGDADTEVNADIIVEKYHEKKQLFRQQQQERDRDRLEELKSKRL